MAQKHTAESIGVVASAHNVTPSDVQAILDGGTSWSAGYRIPLSGIGARAAFKSAIQVTHGKSDVFVKFDVAYAVTGSHDAITRAQSALTPIGKVAANGDINLSDVSRAIDTAHDWYSAALQSGLWIDRSGRGRGRRLNGSPDFLSNAPAEATSQPEA